MIPVLARFIAGAARFYVAAGAALGALGAMLANGGRFSAALDLFAHFAPLYLVVSAIALGIELAWTRRPAVVGAALVGLVAAGALIAPEYMRPPPAAPATGGRPLVLVQFNALWTNHNDARIVDWIVAQNPDVVMIEEAMPWLRDRLVERTGWHVIGRRTTVMIFSRHPVTGVGVRPDAPYEGAPTWVNARMDGPWGPLPLLALHASWPTRDLQRRGTPIIEGVIEAIGRDDLILAGDFNSTPWSQTRRDQDRAFGMTRVTRGIPTWPAWLGPAAFLPIDHVYIGDRWGLVSIAKGPALASDHYPLVVRLARR